jgi:hypothetical protein
MVDGLHTLNAIEPKNLLQLLYVGRGRDRGGDLTNVQHNISLLGIVTMNPPYTTNIS